MADTKELELYVWNTLKENSIFPDFLSVCDLVNSTYDIVLHFKDEAVSYSKIKTLADLFKSDKIEIKCEIGYDHTPEFCCIDDVAIVVVSINVNFLPVL